jgi:hypothetical protein
MEHKLNGYIPSQPDSRDYKLEMYGISNEDRPKKFILNDLPPVENQGSTGQCVAYSLANLIARNQFLETGQMINYSKGFIYAQKIFDYTEGMVPRVALSRIVKYGTVEADRFELREDYKEVKEAYDRWLSEFESFESMLQFSKPNRFESFARLSGVNEIKDALLDNRMVSIAVSVRSNFDRPNSANFISYDDEQNIRGGHMISVVGYDDERQAFLIQNSWGKSYGDNGFAWLSYDYPLLEAWGIFDWKPEKYETIIKLQIGNEKMTVNGKEKELRVAPFLKQYSDEFSATCTEIRPVFEEIGDVEWDKETNTVIIKV